MAKYRVIYICKLLLYYNIYYVNYELSTYVDTCISLVWRALQRHGIIHICSWAKCVKTFGHIHIFRCFYFFTYLVIYLSRCFDVLVISIYLYMWVSLYPVTDGYMNICRYLDMWVLRSQLSIYADTFICSNIYLSTYIDMFI